MSETLNQENAFLKAKNVVMVKRVHPHPPKRATLPCPGELRCLILEDKLIFEISYAWDLVIS